MHTRTITWPKGGGAERGERAAIWGQLTATRVEIVPTIGFCIVGFWFRFVLFRLMHTQLMRMQSNLFFSK